MSDYNPSAEIKRIQNFRFKVNYYSQQIEFYSCQANELKEHAKTLEDAAPSLAKAELRTSELLSHIADLNRELLKQTHQLHSLEISVLEKDFENQHQSSF